MTAQEGHCCLPLVHHKSDPPSTVAKSAPFTSELSREYQKLSTESLDAVRVLAYALVKE
jgi:hypothetical protein